MAHTPGPWRVDECGDIQSASGKPVVVQGELYDHTFMDPDDALLIAAAPELLAALKDFMDGDGDVHAKVLAARAALLKAEGK